MANKKLSQFNTVTEVDENYRIPAFKANQDNYDILPSNLGKSVSIWDGTATGITAYAGGGQANATSLTKRMNRVTTVGSSGDSCKLPAALAGMTMSVSNSTATSMNLFPASGENFEGLAANTAVAITTMLTREFHCFADGEWTEL